MEDSTSGPTGASADLECQIYVAAELLALRDAGRAALHKTAAAMPGEA